MELSPEEIAGLDAGGCVQRDGFLGPTWAALIHSVARGLFDSVDRQLGLPGVFSRSLAKSARSLPPDAGRLASGALRPAATGKEAHIDLGRRGDRMGWLDPGGPGIGTLFARFEALRLSLNRAAELGLRRFEVQLACYPGGGARYARHRDAFSGDNQRVVTAIYYLNPGWRPADGGLLRLHTATGPLDVEPRLDRLIVFRSERVEHEVLPAHAPRLAITAWYRRDQA